MRHLRVGSITIRLGAAGAVLAVLAVLTPSPAFAGSDGIAPAEVSEPSAQTGPDAGPGTGPETLPTSPETSPETGPVTDPATGSEPEAPADGTTTPAGEPVSTPPAEPETAPTPSTTPAAGAARPSTTEATTDPADAEPGVELRQYERVGGEWQPSDGSVDFGNEIRYVLRVVVPASQTLPAAQLRAYVPGWDKAGDHVTNVPARLVAGSARCSVECDVEANENTGLVTWRLGDVVAGDEDLEITTEFTARFGQLPLDAQFDASGTFIARAWCRGELSWTQPAARLAAAQAAAGPVYSNAVTATAMALEAMIGTPVAYPLAPGISATAGPTHGHHSGDGAMVLPNTGGPQAALAVAGLVLVGLGGLTVSRSRRRATSLAAAPTESGSRLSA